MCQGRRNDAPGTATGGRTVRSISQARDYAARPGCRAPDRGRRETGAACRLCAGADGAGPGRSAAARKCPHRRVGGAVERRGEEPTQQAQAGFLDSMRDAVFGRPREAPGSVPRVRPQGTQWASEPPAPAEYPPQRLAPGAPPQPPLPAGFPLGGGGGGGGAGADRSSAPRRRRPRA